MARQNDIIAQKQRRQKIILAVGGVIFLVLAVIQGPKLWKQLNPSEPAPVTAPAPSASTGSGSADTGALQAAAPRLSGTAVEVAKISRTGADTTLAGVKVKPWQVPSATPAQLWTFNRFRVKDPFVPQVKPENASGQIATAAVRRSDAATAARKTAARQSAPSTIAAAEAPLFATIEVNGKPVSVAVKNRFARKTFMLLSLEQRKAKIGLPGGGSFGGKAKTVTLEMGKPLTLIDAASGDRFSLRLLYTGGRPEVVQAFSAKSK
jgi:hypothetical protein